MRPYSHACHTHVQLAITIESLNHCPKLDMGLGKCDPFVTIQFFDQSTETSKKKMTYNTEFDETFVFFVHAVNIENASGTFCRGSMP